MEKFICKCKTSPVCGSPEYVADITRFCDFHVSACAT